MPDLTKPPITTNTSKSVTIISGELPPTDPPSKVASAAAPGPSSRPPVHGIGMPDGGIVQLCPREYRPLGEIMDQETGAAGIWARVSGREWIKTAVPGITRAAAILMKAKTSNEGLDLLLAVEASP